jgi:hypothetical protein
VLINASPLELDANAAAARSSSKSSRQTQLRRLVASVGAGERLTPLRRLRFDPTRGCGRRRPG